MKDCILFWVGAFGKSRSFNSCWYFLGLYTVTFDQDGKTINVLLTWLTLTSLFIYVTLFLFLPVFSWNLAPLLLLPCFEFTDLGIIPRSSTYSHSFYFLIPILTNCMCSQQDEGQESLEEELDVLVLDEEGDQVSLPPMVCSLATPRSSLRKEALCASGLPIMLIWSGQRH